MFSHSCIKYSMPSVDYSMKHIIAFETYYEDIVSNY